MKHEWYRALVLSAALFLVGCAGQYSDDPEIAMKQKFAEACGQIDQGIVTATALGKAGALSSGEEWVIDRVDVVYREICSGPAVDLAVALKGAAVKAAVGELCPELIVGDDWIVTATQATTCAARQYLLLELEKAQ